MILSASAIHDSTQYYRSSPQLKRTRFAAKHRELLSCKLIGLLRERELPCRRWQSLDKAFACAWLSDTQVVIGTKCNKLLLVNAEHYRKPQIPLLQQIALPRAPERPPDANPPHQSFVGVQSALWTISAQMAGHSSSSSAGSAMEDSDTVAGMLARAIAALDDQYVVPPSPGHFVVGNGGVQIANCGIHSISVSPCGTLLASGGSDPSDCQIFRLVEPQAGPIVLQPSQTLVSHKDWLFGSAWITNRHLVTGSRDTCLKLWCVHPNSTRPNRRPLQTVCEKSGKVRDVKYLATQQRVVSLSVDGTVRFWDAHLSNISSVKMPHEREVVCMACSETLVAAGSQNHATLLDSRQQGVVTSIPNADLNHGVRSLAFSNNLLSIGGGKGKINFYELRAGRYLESSSTSFDGQRRAQPCHLQTGTGFLLRNQVYMDHFNGMEVRNACYAHAWNPGANKLLAVGGPLAFGLTGCYMGIWE